MTAGRRFRTLTVLDDYNRELLGVEMDFLLPAQARPAQLRADTGPKFISAKLSEWFEPQGISLHWLNPAS